MKKYSKLTSAKELDFFSIEEDGKGGKQVHINGYTYQSDVDWKYVECIFCIVPLAEFVKGMKEDDEYVSNLLSECKQGIKDCTEEEIVKIINEYFNGKEPTAYVEYDEITEDFPLGNYVCGEYTNDEYVKDLFGNEIGLTNLQLEDYGMEVVVEVADDDDTYFNVGYRHKGKDDTEWYVENDFEHEVANDIEVCAAIAKKVGEMEIKRMYCVTYVGLSDSEYDANGYSEVALYDTKAAAKAKLKAWRDNEIEELKEQERDYEILADEDDEVRISWCAHGEQVRIEVHEVVMNK